MSRNPSRCIQTERKRPQRHHDPIRFDVSWIARRRDGPEIRETLHILNPERRNIVALVRQQAVESSVFPDNPGAVDSCDNLLTIGVDNKRSVGL